MSQLLLLHQMIRDLVTGAPSLVCHHFDNGSSNEGRFHKDPSTLFGSEARQHRAQAALEVPAGVSVSLFSC